MSSFSIWSLECHLPLFDDVVAVDFLAIIPRNFARIDRWRIKQFWILVNDFVESLVETAGAFPKFNRIFLADSKEATQFTKDGCNMNLIWMGFTIENFPCCIDGIGDNDDLGHILLIACLVDAIPNREKLCFSTSNKSCIMNHLDQRMIN